MGPLHRAPTPSLIGGGWQEREYTGSGTPSHNVRGQGHLTTRGSPNSSWPCPGLAGLVVDTREQEELLAILGGVFPPMGVGASPPLHPSGALGDTPPWSRHPESTGFVLRCLLPHGKHYLAAYLHFPMMKPAVKMPHAAVGGGGRAGGGCASPHLSFLLKYYATS
ncbi:hypothetical protein PAL_GLEAN10003181 [Pteropus alecto]|uniref:Uncharacterized protein n=1 Tax=Pteropus alecto TaxID=9402 RepID=L5JTU3_PTEAL|nr:hypothetical protein PAL_GLEAN10003181 [Pteropus alecto]